MKNVLTNPRQTGGIVCRKSLRQAVVDFPGSESWQLNRYRRSDSGLEATV